MWFSRLITEFETGVKQTSRPIVVTTSIKVTSISAGLINVWALFKKICGGPTSGGDLCQTFGGDPALTLPLPLSSDRGITPENVLKNQDARTCILMHFGISKSTFKL